MSKKNISHVVASPRPGEKIVYSLHRGDFRQALTISRRTLDGDCSSTVCVFAIDYRLPEHIPYEFLHPFSAALLDALRLGSLASAQRTSFLRATPLEVISPSPSCAMQASSRGYPRHPWPSCCSHRGQLRVTRHNRRARVRTRTLRPTTSVHRRVTSPCTRVAHFFCHSHTVALTVMSCLGVPTHVCLMCHLKCSHTR